MVQHRGLYSLSCRLGLSVSGIFYSIAWHTKAGSEFNAFHYYMTDSNCYNALVACMMIPFAVEGIRKRRFSYPRWLAVLHFSSTFCITITMVFACCIISWYDFELAFGSLCNIFLHLICPSLLLISFFLSECGYQYTKKEALLSTIPFLAYSALYLINVILLKRWEDIYQLTSMLPWPLSLILMMIFAAFISFALLYFYNRFGVNRKKKLTRSWPSELTAEQLNEELFNYGKLNGKAVDSTKVSLNLDIQENYVKYIIVILMKRSRNTVKEQSKETENNHNSSVLFPNIAKQHRSAVFLIIYRIKISRISTYPLPGRKK